MTQEEVSLKELFGDFLCMKEGERVVVTKGFKPLEFTIVPAEPQEDSSQEKDNARE